MSDGAPEGVLRGGSWNNDPENVRAANRNRNNPTNWNNNVGFRCARPPSRPMPPGRNARSWRLADERHGGRVP